MHVFAPQHHDMLMDFRMHTASVSGSRSRQPLRSATGQRPTVTPTLTGVTSDGDTQRESGESAGADEAKDASALLGFSLSTSLPPMLPPPAILIERGLSSMNFCPVITCEGAWSRDTRTCECQGGTEAALCERSGFAVLLSG